MNIEKGFGTVEAVIHNKTDYQLTHLLEHGHDIIVSRNGKKMKVGHVNGKAHIAMS